MTQHKVQILKEQIAMQYDVIAAYRHKIIAIQENIADMNTEIVQLKNDRFLREAADATSD